MKVSLVVASGTLLLGLLGACSSEATPTAEEVAPPSIAGAASSAGTKNGPGCGKATGNTATDFARAMGICEDADSAGFGLVAAEFTRGFADSDEPASEQHGILSTFGSVLKPREGKTFGVLSTGYAQEFNGAEGRAFAEGEDWWQDTTTKKALPAGYPKAADGCQQSRDLTDVIVLKLTLKAPKTAAGFKFDFNFHSSEWPEYICTSYNDGFLAYLTSKGKTDNISFDAKNNPVSVNNAFFDRCTPNAKVGCEGDAPSTMACSGGSDELAGTGFGAIGSGCGNKKVTRGGATGWLSSSAPVEAGETFTLQLAIWDAGDGTLDSSVLLDNFRWVDGKVDTATERADDVR